KYDPGNPHWPARDRFVLSCGHASMLLYSILHLAGVRAVNDVGEVLDELSISLEDIQSFRQLGSPCAGHPEYGEAAGIEMTTGPLGQGVGTSVGMAIASKWLSARYGQPGLDLCGYDTYVLCSDGDIMEGLGCEAASIAGHLKLSNLCWIYDDNRITIEGRTGLAFSEQVATRFESLGWQTIEVDDANDLPAIRQAFETFRSTEESPTLIVLRSIIGYGAPNKSDSHSAHGSPLGEEEVRLTKEVYGWPTDPLFLVPEAVRPHFVEGVGKRGGAAYTSWQDQLSQYRDAHPDQCQQLEEIWSGGLPTDWDELIPVFEPDSKGLATRVSSGQVLNGIAERLPWLLGGSADLAPSTMTLLNADGMGEFSADDFAGRNFHFGIREHGMAATVNGLALAGLRSYAATFFVFTDYLRPSLRLSSLMHLPVLYVMTHDSIGLGEDGPTHQPVEHLATCRAMPGVLVMRPADANEVAEAYRVAIQSGSPTVFVLTRQAVATLDRSRYGSVAGVGRGGYVLVDPEEGTPEVILMGTGSEVSICLAARQQLQADGIAARIVSLPCFELFDQQDASYRQEVLP
ncbi:MAG TPA: transketolase, partial [Planctomycetaceae bacterium]|nr:transketolase [Planctomycetaceae bacterium]